MKKPIPSLIVVMSLACTTATSHQTTADAADILFNDADSKDIGSEDAQDKPGSDIETQDKSDSDSHKTVNGIARYLKRISHADGTVSTTWQPIRATVVRMEINGEVLEEMTESDGTFSFSTVAPEGSVVELIASTMGPRRNAQVIPSPDKTPYTVKQPAGPNMNFDIEEPFPAGAFNVIDAIVSVSDQLVGLTKDDIPALLLIRWGPDYISPCISCFHADTNTLDLTGQPGDEDAHDDSVLYHELGHYVEAAYGHYYNPEMPHDIDQKVLPTLAWSEGFASWFQGVILNRSIYVDLRPDNVYTFDLESPATEALGTADNSIDSNHSESLVFGLLWDLTDSPENDDDGVSFATSEVLKVALTLMDSGDIGFEGADLADFINRWRCVFSDRDEALSGLLKAVNFPYDFTQAPTCL